MKGFIKVNDHKILYVTFGIFLLASFHFVLQLNLPILSDRTVQTATTYTTVRDLSCSQIQPGQPVTVTDFGAIPNDDKDDYASVQKAFDCAHQIYTDYGDKNDRGVVKIFFPAGTYTLSETIRIDSSVQPRFGGSIELVGAGSDKTTLLAKHSGNLLEINLHTRKVIIVDRRISVSDINFETDRASNGAAVAISSIDHLNKDLRTGSVKIKNVSVQGKSPGADYFKNGIRLVNIFYPIINDVTVIGTRDDTTNQNCDANGCLDQALLSSDRAKSHSCIFVTESYATMIDRLVCDGGHYGVYINKAGEGEMVSNSTISNVNIGIELSTDRRDYTGFSPLDGKIIGNDITAYRRGIDITSKESMVIADNNFKTHSSLKHEDIVFSDVRYSIIDKNNFSGPDRPNRSNIFFTGSNLQQLENYSNIVTHNLFVNSNTAVILGPGTTETLIKDNDLINVSRPLWNLSGAEVTPGITNIVPLNLEVRIKPDNQDYGPYSSDDQTIYSDSVLQFRWDSVGYESCNFYDHGNLISSEISVTNIDVQEPKPSITRWYKLDCIQPDGKKVGDLIKVSRAIGT